MSGDLSRSNFPVRHLLKDVQLFLDEAVRPDLATPALQGARARLEQALKASLGDADYSALATAITARPFVTVRQAVTLRHCPDRYCPDRYRPDRYRPD